MFMRVVQIIINLEKLGGFRRHYDKKVLPQLQRSTGLFVRQFNAKRPSAG